MTSLAQETCTACRQGAPAVPESEREVLLQQLPEWRLVAADGADRLEKDFLFKNFREALAFANAVGELAEDANHHPELRVEWGKTTVIWWTHTIQGLHRNDFVMAAKTDVLRSP
jgi:4a-hydroxytetrahydrobiopterin dehydratase